MLVVTIVFVKLAVPSCSQSDEKVTEFAEVSRSPLASTRFTETTVLPPAATLAGETERAPSVNTVSELPVPMRRVFDEAISDDDIDTLLVAVKTVFQSAEAIMVSLNWQP